MLAWATLRWIVRRPRSPAAKGSAYGWRRRSAPSCAACFSFRRAFDRPHHRDNVRLLNRSISARLGQHRAGGGARRRNHPARRLRHRPWSRRGPAWRRGGRRRTPAQIADEAESLTGQYISGRRRIGVRHERRQANGAAIAILGAHGTTSRTWTLVFRWAL